jgi:hypothetical protein
MRRRTKKLSRRDENFGAKLKKVLAARTKKIMRRERGTMKTLSQNF